MRFDRERLNLTGRGHIIFDWGSLTCKPLDRNEAVSMVRKFHPRYEATEVQMVVLAVPGGPKRMALY